MSIQIPENLKYTEDHDWILIEDDTVTIGITDFAQNALGDIVFVELPEVGRVLSKGETFGAVESVKTVADLHAPMSGKIIAINDELDAQADLCNSAPYNSWTIKIKLSSPDESQNLLDASQYKKFCESAQ